MSHSNLFFWIVKRRYRCLNSYFIQQTKFQCGKVTCPGLLVREQILTKTLVSFLLSWYLFSLSCSYLIIIMLNAYLWNMIIAKNEHRWCQINYPEVLNILHLYFYVVIKYTIMNNKNSYVWKVQFNSVAQLCPPLCDPMDCSTPGFPVLHHLPELAQSHVRWVNDIIQLSCPLSSPSPHAFNLFQHQGLFQWVGSLYQVTTVLKLEFQHQSLK